jgi:membrane-bound ClpP family serine protease
MIIKIGGLNNIMTVFSYLPINVLAILMLSVGTMFLFYTIKAPKYNKVGLSSMVFLAYTIPIFDYFYQSNNFSHSYGKIFGMIIIIFVIWLIVGLKVKSVYTKKLK